MRLDEFSWFDVSRYEPVRFWGLAEWSWAISLRSLLFLMIEGSGGDGEIVKFMERLLAEPADFFKNKQLNKRLSRPSPSVAFVSDVLVGEAFHGPHNENLLRFRDCLDAVDEWLCSFDDECLRFHELLGRGYIDLCMERMPSLALCERVVVDISGSDEQVVEDFKSWLAAKRLVRGGGQRKNFSDSDVSDWARFNVLAAIDIEIFCRYAKKTVTNATLGRLLFPDECDVDVAERVRKVVRPMVAQMMSGDFLTVLAEQAARGWRAEQNSGDFIPD